MIGWFQTRDSIKLAWLVGWLWTGDLGWQLMVTNKLTPMAKVAGKSTVHCTSLALITITANVSPGDTN